MNFKRKIGYITLALPLAFGVFVPTLSVAADEITANKNETEDSSQEFTYNYNGIEISSNVELTKEMQSQLFNKIDEKGSDFQEIGGIVTPNYVPGPSYPGYIIQPEVNRYHSNETIKSVADYFSGWVLEPINYAAERLLLDKIGLTKHIVSELTTWTDNIGPTYTGAWTSEAYSSYSGLYEQYATLVHYESSDYNTPLKVQYWQVSSNSTSLQ